MSYTATTTTTTLPPSPSPSSSASDDFAALVEEGILAGSPFPSIPDSELLFNEEDQGQPQGVVENESASHDKEEDSDDFEERESLLENEVLESTSQALFVDSQRETLRSSEGILGKRQRAVDEALRLSPDKDTSFLIQSDEDKVEASNMRGGSCPPHPGFMWGVCIRCGVAKPSDESGENGVALRYIHEELELSKNEAARLRQDELKQVLSKRKLYLILDLDHTLLNSARFQEVSPEEQPFLTALFQESESSEGPKSTSAEQKDNVQAGKKGLYILPKFHMWTKLRPYVHNFLQQASDMFEMYVYTMGERPYALAMAQLLDPFGRYFNGRVISKGDSTHRNIKDLDVVLGAESAVVILDDTEGVWPRHRGNLIVMERYHFFSSSCRHYGIDSCLSSKRKDESELEGGLATALNVLRSVHEAFFHGCDQVQGDDKAAAEPKKDVRQVISSLRAKILMGCRIVFSRIFPVGLSNPESNHLWQLTEALGAQCLPSIDESVTHVVALDKGTDKARWAKQTGRFLVHPSWIDAAYYCWLRPCEEDFPVSDLNTKYLRLSFSKTVYIF